MYIVKEETVLTQRWMEEQVHVPYVQDTILNIAHSYLKSTTILPDTWRLTWQTGQETSSVTSCATAPYGMLCPCTV